MKSYKPYFIALAAILLAAGSYFIAWQNIQEIKSTSKVEIKTEISMDVLLSSVISDNAQAMSQNEVDETVEAAHAAQQKLLDALPHWQRLSQATELKAGKTYIAIVIDDLGVVEGRSSRSIEELPKEVTLAFLPYGKSTLKLAKHAQSIGHEIMVHLPMQPKLSQEGQVINPGSNALYTHLELVEIAPLVEVNLQGLADLSVGVNNHMGSQFTEWEDGLKEVFKVLENHELMFLDSLTTSKSAAAKAVHNIDIPFLKRDVFLDHEIEKVKILEALEKAERVAKTQGYAIAIGHPHHETTDVIKEWVKTLDAKNIQLVPITALIKKVNKQ